MLDFLAIWRELNGIIITLIIAIVIYLMFRQWYLGNKQLFDTVTELDIILKKMNRIEDGLSKISNNINADIMANLEEHNKLEESLSGLEELESYYSKRIELLEHVPVEAADYFTKELIKENERSTFRDIVFFVAGALVGIVLYIGSLFK